jgi:hypothetical protein
MSDDPRRAAEDGERLGEIGSMAIATLLMAQTSPGPLVIVAAEVFGSLNRRSIHGSP